MFIPKPDHLTDQEWKEYWIEFNRCFEINWAHEQAFLKEKGYTFIPQQFTGPYVAPNGKSYQTPEEYQQGHSGWYPCVMKDGICYGLYEVLYKELWKPPMAYPDYRKE